MTVSMQSALETLQAMFDTIDKETITEVLRSQRGHMERTVEILLEFQGERVSPPPSPPPASDAAPRSQQRREGRGESNSGGGGGGFGSDLPSDFLSVDRYSGGGGGGSNGSSGGRSQQPVDVQRQMEQDEALARALQNQMFLRELRNDPSMNRELRGSPSQPASSVSRTASGATSDEYFSAESVLSGMKNMGDAARRKMMLMARSFNARLKGDTASSSTQYRSLPSNEMDDEDDDAQVIAFENSDRPRQNSQNNNNNNNFDEGGFTARRTTGGGGGGGFDDDDDVSLEDRRTRMRQRVVPEGAGSKKDD